MGPRALSVILFWKTLLTILLAPASLAALPTRVEDRTPRDYDQFLFLYERTSAPGQVDLYWHPLYKRYTNEEKAYTYRHAVYPLFYEHGTNYWSKWTFLFLFTGEERYHDDAASDEDTLLAPLFYYGDGDASGERYWAVFPLYGHLKNKLGYNRLDYVLFPLYSSWQYRDYKARGILWPFVMWGGSPARNDLRILPLYSHKIHSGKYERRTVLWPFFQWGSEGLDKKEPRHFFFSFPLYGRKWSDAGNLSAHTFLWLPYLGGFVAYGRDDVRDAVSFNALWFFYQYARSEDPLIRRHVIFPFWGYYRFGSPPDGGFLGGAGSEDDGASAGRNGDGAGNGDDAQAPQDWIAGSFLDGEADPESEEIYWKDALFITPFFARLRTNSALLESQYDMYVPFVWDQETHYRRTRESEYYFKVWPLFQRIETTEGRREFRSLVLWPLRSDEFERNWGTLWSLYENNTYENGDRYVSAMFRLYSRYWSADTTRDFLLGFEYSRGPDFWEFNFAGGLFGYRRDFPIDGEGRSTLELFWLDL